MKNAKNAHFRQIDHHIREISKGLGFTILPSYKAFEKFSFVKDYFKQKPEEGYFIWVKRSIDYPLVACISIASMDISQSPKNLIVIERNAKAEVNSVCCAVTKNLEGNHRGSSKIVLKENSKLAITHFHSWGKKDLVSSNVEFFLEKGAKLSYSYKCLEVPGKLQTESSSHLQADTSANSVFTILAKDGEVKMCDSTFLNGKNANGISRVRMVGDEKSKIFARSRIVANSASTGHVDCLGLLLAEKSSIHAIPELINKNRNASLTHEASVGKISKEVLSYLRTRGLSEDEAIDLIVAGFLGEEKPIIINGRAIQSNLFM